jgi:hypothetical protein
VVLAHDLEIDRHLGVEAMQHLVEAPELANLDARRLAEIADVREKDLDLPLVRELPEDLLELDLQIRDLLLELTDVRRDGADFAELPLQLHLLRVQPIEVVAGVLVDQEEVPTDQKQGDGSDDSGPGSHGKLGDVLQLRVDVLVHLHDESPASPSNRPACLPPPRPSRPPPPDSRGS